MSQFCFEMLATISKPGTVGGAQPIHQTHLYLCTLIPRYIRLFQGDVFGRKPDLGQFWKIKYLLMDNGINATHLRHFRYTVKQVVAAYDS